MIQLNIPTRRVDKPSIGDLTRGGKQWGQHSGFGDDSTPAIIRTRPGQPESVLLASLLGSRTVCTGLFRSGAIAADCTIWPSQKFVLLFFWVLHLPWHVAPPVGATVICIPRIAVMISHTCEWKAEVYDITKSEFRNEFELGAN